MQLDSATQGWIFLADKFLCFMVILQFLDPGPAWSDKCWDLERPCLWAPSRIVLSEGKCLKAIDGVLVQPWPKLTTIWNLLSFLLGPWLEPGPIKQKSTGNKSCSFGIEQLKRPNEFPRRHMLQELFLLNSPSSGTITCIFDTREMLFEGFRSGLFLEERCVQVWFKLGSSIAGTNRHWMPE